MNRLHPSSFTLLSLLSLILLPSTFILCSCASVRYTERPDGSREFRSISLAKDVSATHKTPTSETVISSSSAEATHTVGTLGAVALGALAGGAVAGPAGAGIGAASSGTLAELWQTIQDRMQTPAPTTAPSTPSTPPSTVSTPISSTDLWRAYDAGDFYMHGTPGEDAYREAQIAAAAAAGYDCIRVTLKDPPSTDAAAHLLRWRSDKDGQYKLGDANWTERMSAAGIPRTQWDATGLTADQRARWRYYGADYDPGRLQVISDGKVISL